MLKPLGAAATGQTSSALKTPPDVATAMRQHTSTLFNSSDPRAVGDAVFALVKLLPAPGEAPTPQMKQELLALATGGDGMILNSPLLGSRDGQGKLSVKDGLDVAAFETALRQLFETPIGDLPGRRLVKDESAPSADDYLEVYVDNKKQFIAAGELPGIQSAGFWVEPRTVAATTKDEAAFSPGGVARKGEGVVGNSGAKVDIGKGQGVLGHLLGDKVK